MSSSHERQIKGYLKPSQHSFMQKYISLYEMSESQAVNQAVKALQESMPKEIRERIMTSTKSKNSY